ncbi:unnamed protein product [Symbiodinium sp. CCMP2456]|nr:unnamed protein product [Symbiodinium sp. CCMP2456]
MTAKKAFLEQHPDMVHRDKEKAWKASQEYSDIIASLDPRQEPKRAAQPKQPKRAAQPKEPKSKARPKEPKSKARPKEPKRAAQPKEPKRRAQPKEPEKTDVAMVTTSTQTPVWARELIPCHDDDVNIRCLHTFSEQEGWGNFYRLADLDKDMVCDDGPGLKLGCVCVCVLLG